MKLKTYIGISLFDDGSTVIKQSEFDDKGNNSGDSEITARDVAEALQLKTANDELADYVDEVVGNKSGEPVADDPDSPQPMATAKKPRKRKGAK